MTRPIPEGYHTVTPGLTIDGAAEAIEVYKKAFGAVESGGRALDPSGKKVWHAELRIGDSIVFLNDSMPEMGGPPTTSSLYLYVENVDAAWKRATDAGLKIMMPLADQFWGDRMGTLTDRWGNRWSLSTHVKDLSPAEMKKAQDDFVAQMKQKR
jgi:PhnB protein